MPLNTSLLGDQAEEDGNNLLRIARSVALPTLICADILHLTNNTCISTYQAMVGYTDDELKKLTPNLFKRVFELSWSD